jgi:hypothetical protein
MKTDVSIIEKEKNKEEEEMRERKMAILLFVILIVILIVGISVLKERESSPIIVDTYNVASNDEGLREEKRDEERNEGVIIIESGEIIIGGN